MRLERIFIETDDNIELQGLLAIPKEKTDKIVVSVHGMQSNCLKVREKILEEEITNSGLAYLSFNNRGHELMSYTRKLNGEKELNGGAFYEEALDSYYDIKGAIEKAILLGYKEIYIQGHSLGCTKTVYTYNKMKKENYKNLEYIKGIILLSLVDLVGCQKYDIGMEAYNKALEFANNKEKEGKLRDVMPEDVFDHPISVKTYLRYYKYNEEINFARFDDENYNFEELNNIDVPLFLRWGETDLVVQGLDDLIELLKNKINNFNLDIGYISETDHGYTNKEKELASEEIKFITQIR